MLLFGYSIRIYHVESSSECKIETDCLEEFCIMVRTLKVRTRVSSFSGLHSAYSCVIQKLQLKVHCAHFVGPVSELRIAH